MSVGVFNRDPNLLNVAIRVEQNFVERIVIVACKRLPVNLLWMGFVAMNAPHEVFRAEIVHTFTLFREVHDKVGPVVKLNLERGALSKK